MSRILIVEDDASLAELMSMHLEDIHYQAVMAPTLRDARDALAESDFDAILLDQQLPDGYGLDLLGEIRARAPDLPVIMITGLHDTALPIEAIKQGAYDFLRKPIQEQEFDDILAHALRKHQPPGSADVEAIAEERRHFPRIIGNSRAIIEVCKMLGHIAPTDSSVLISGETGTGKEVVAQAIHHHSGRGGPFVAVNCSAMVDTLLESELFGHEKGSFTGAERLKPGKFELAEGGTLFLDEIGEMSPNLQAKLLRVLETHTFERVGGTRTLSASVRILAATHCDLKAEVLRQSFREDLYFRLNVFNVHLPPLRERREDIRPLVQSLLARIQRKVHKSVSRLSSQAWEALGAYAWPGNIRELDNVLTRAVILARDNLITADLLGIMPTREEATPGDAGGTATPLISLDELQQRHVAAVLAHTQGHKGRACEILGISRPALERRLARLGHHNTSASAGMD